VESVAATIEGRVTQTVLESVIVVEVVPPPASMLPLMGVV